MYVTCQPCDTQRPQHVNPVPQTYDSDMLHLFDTLQKERTDRYKWPGEFGDRFVSRTSTSSLSNRLRASQKESPAGPLPVCRTIVRIRPPGIDTSSITTSTLGPVCSVRVISCAVMHRLGVVLVHVQGVAGVVAVPFLAFVWQPGRTSKVITSARLGLGICRLGPRGPRNSRGNGVPNLKAWSQSRERILVHEAAEDKIGID